MICKNVISEQQISRSISKWDLAFQFTLNLYIWSSWLLSFMIHPSHKTHDVLLFIIVSRNKKNNANCMTHQNSGWKGSSCTWALLITLIVHAKLKIVYYGTRLKRKSYLCDMLRKTKIYYVHSSTSHHKTTINGV